MFFVFECGHISPCSGVSIPSCLHTQVFQKLDTAKDGLVTQTSIQRFYRQDSSEMEGVWFDHTHRTSLHAPITSINYADFENYYEGVSIETEKDSDFISDLRTCWAL
jgi:hypothetical protein